MNLVKNLNVIVSVEEALTRLRKHRESHTRIVKEAREGYVEKARAALSAKLDQLSSGKIVALDFSLRLPQDYTSVYDTAIEALTLHKGDTIELNGQQVRNLMMDEWDWSYMFLFENAGYSSTAQAVADAKGLSQQS